MTKTITILGAGKSSYNLVSYLSKNQERIGIDIKVISNQTPKYINDFQKIDFQKIDINDNSQISKQIKSSFIVVSLLPPKLHYQIALICSSYKINMITASYLDEKIKSLEKKFKKNNCFLFMEIGLDPGLDHLSAKKDIDDLNKKGKILGFESYTGGLIKKNKENPWGYKFTWNPMNVITAGVDGAKYLDDGKIIDVPYDKIFSSVKNIKFKNSDLYEGYPNRDSLKYRSLYKLENVKTLKRGTLRHPGFCKSWNVLVNLGLTDDINTIKNPKLETYFDFFNYKLNLSDLKKLKKYIKKNFLIESDSKEFKNLKWLGLFSNYKLLNRSKKASHLLMEILKNRWKLKKDDIDIVVMYHSFIYKENNHFKKKESFMKIEGKNNLETAMSKTVGLPIALLIELIIKKNLEFKGVFLPFDEIIYNPLLNKLEDNGITFNHSTSNIQKYP